MNGSRPLEAYDNAWLLLVVIIGRREKTDQELRQLGVLAQKEFDTRREEVKVLKRCSEEVEPVGP
jgi:hypothetical protein